MSLGLALSGGGAKGAAHIGVIKALEEENIKIDYISGTSSGSIIAALYACGYKPNELLTFFNMYCNQIGDYDKLIPFKIMNTAFTGKINVKGLAKGDKLEYLINTFCNKKGISDISTVKFPLAIPAVDINSGEVIYFCNKSVNDNNSFSRTMYDDIPSYKYNGKLCSIVRASSSFPGVFEPKILDGRILVDGGVRVKTPVSILRKIGANKVIAVSFEKNKRYNDKNLSIVSVALKSFDIMSHQLNQEELKKADIVIEPKLPSNISLLDCSKTNYIAKLGYLATKGIINDIKNIEKSEI
jgi:NTE family protein